MTESESKIAAFIASEILKEPDRAIDPGEPLISSGLIDSFSLVDLALFIEDTFGVRIDDAERPAPGTEVFSPSSESGQGAGRIVDAAASPEGGFEALAVVQISSAEAGDLRLRDAQGPALRLLDLPYAFPPAEG